MNETIENATFKINEIKNNIKKVKVHFWNSLTVSARSVITKNMKADIVDEGYDNFIQLTKTYNVALPIQMLIFRKFLEMNIDDKEDFVLISFDNQSKKTIQNNLPNRNDFLFVLHPQFLPPESGKIGHWVLSVYDKGRSRIYVLNSLSSWKVHHSVLNDVFPDALCLKLDKIPQQNSIDCGYWCLFYEFLISCVSKSMDSFEAVLKGTAHLMDDFKFIVNSLTEYCRKKM